MKDIHMIAFDLDGTLLRTDKTISKRTYDALRLAAERGIELVPASGRSFSGIPDEVKRLPGVNYFITTNGAAVYSSDGRLIHERALTRELAAEIIRTVNAERAVAAAYIDGFGYMEHNALNTAIGMGMDASVIEYFKSTRIFVDDIERCVLEHDKSVQVLTFAVNPCDKRIRSEITDAVSVYEGITCVFGSDSDIDINHHMAGKGKAMLKIAAIKGINPAHIAAFGDNENDMDMLQSSGLSVAVSNSSDNLKSEADIVTYSNDEDGVAEVIEKILKRLS